MSTLWRRIERLESKSGIHDAPPCSECGVVPDSVPTEWEVTFGDEMDDDRESERCPGCGRITVVRLAFAERD